MEYGIQIGTPFAVSPLGGGYSKSSLLTAVPLGHNPLGGVPTPGSFLTHYTPSILPRAYATLCRCHTTSGIISYSHPSPVGLSAVSHPPNSIYRMAFFPLQDLIAEQWEEHTDEKTKKKFWYNKITKEVSFSLRR